MPKYISKDGKWYPSKEKVGLINHTTGEPYIYEGADRAALFELWQAGVDTFGEDFRKNSEFLQAIRNQGFTSVDKFLKWIGYNKKKVDEEFEQKAAIVNKHELPEKVRMIDKMGGGRDFSGMGKDIPGGFGSTPTVAK